jgi:hypothetical protein
MPDMMDTVSKTIIEVKSYETFFMNDNGTNVCHKGLFPASACIPLN